MKPIPTHASEAELLRLMLAGDAAAFATLYDRCQGGVYRFALRMSDSEAMAQDVTHDVFLALMRDGAQFDPARGTLAAYLYGITRHKVLQLLKRERAFVSMDEEAEESSWDEVAVAPDDPLGELSRHETIEAVRQAIQALPAHYREVVLLCNMHELNYEEAAGVIGCAVGTVRSRLHRARGLLLEKLRGLNEAGATRETAPEKKASDATRLTRARFAI
ncbi:MAG: RNA polymerase sigma factor [Acidobacteria bacterium]|nr:RNA polymerase sigma factor [Acidobacteriota bacterium]